jgi:G3E family GTPase
MLRGCSERPQTEAPMVELIPVTVLTGFLGAGKTTLLNRILTQQHGRRLAVIINEFGEIGIDHQLVVATEDEIVEMNNGCICCTVRGDLIQAIDRILEREDAVDHIVIETTGLADPAPIIQSFFLDDQLRRTVRLDAIVTVVDTRHILLHWEGEEAREQIAFADVLLLNKIDLASEPELEQLTQRIRRLNPLARIVRTQGCELPIEQVLGLRAFDLSRALGVDPLLLDDVAHEHDASVGSVCLRREGVIDDSRLSRWLMRLGQERGSDLYRIKGILNVNDERRRFVVHGVHMLLDGRPGLPWKPNETRTNQLVFIGKSLDRGALQRSFDACFKSSTQRDAVLESVG